MTTLEDLRVLDLSDGVAGAYCGALFAGYGADVIAIEPPSGSRLRQDSDWERLGAGKTGVTLDIGTATGSRVFRRMVEQSNVVIETFEPGRVEALGLSFADLYGIKRRIILVSLPDAGGDAGAAMVVGLNAFAATAIAAHNADAYEVPQHIQIAVEQCIAAASDGTVSPPGHPPFLMSEVEWEPGTAPRLGEHNVEFYRAEVGLAPRDLVRLRATGVI